MIIPVVRKVLERNDAAAAENRALFDRHDLVCVNILGGAGSGKTALLEAVLPRLRDRLRLAVLEGDLATTRDAERIAALQVPVVQLTTDGGCHLTATHVQRALKGIDTAQLDLLIIENVGNPICPANFDLGEHIRMAVLSVTEGEDKPVKYPLLFRRADLVVLTKCDLLDFVDFNVAAVHCDLQRIRPGVRVLETAARRGSGVDALVDWLEGLPRSTQVKQRGAG